MAGRAPDKEREREKEKERKQTCVGCKKKFTKSDYCVICGMCNYWYHKTCAGISDDIYKCIETYYKDNSHTFWNCMPCSTYAKGITARMREIEGRLEAVEKHQGEQDDEMKTVKQSVSATNREVKRLEKRIDEEKSGDSVFQELRDRKARRLNVVFYGIGEAPDENASIEEKKGWDRQSCQNVFKAVKINLNSNTLRFLRRIGEKGDRPRPLLVGMACIEDKECLLANAKYLRDTQLNRVGISPDLTPQEIQEEKDMVEEAEKRNSNLSQEDVAKNMKWLVVGQKGEKRLFKGVERPPPTENRPPPPANQQRSNQARNTGNPLQQQHLTRPRTNSKRGLSGSESDSETRTQSNKPRKKQPKQQPPKQPPPKQPPPEQPLAADTDSSSEEEMSQDQLDLGRELAATTLD